MTAEGELLEIMQRGLEHGGGSSAGPTYNADGLSLLLQHQLCVLAYEDLLQEQVGCPCTCLPETAQDASRGEALCLPRVVMPCVSRVSSACTCPASLLRV